VQFHFSLAIKFLSYNRDFLSREAVKKLSFRLGGRQAHSLRERDAVSPKNWLLLPAVVKEICQCIFVWFIYIL
jgi:hypothetical protein